MKLLITTDWYKPVINGVVTSVCNLEDGFRALGHEVKILTLSDSHTSYTDGNVTYIGSASAAFVYPLARVSYLGGQQELAHILAWKPDVVHSNCEFSTFRFARIISQKCNIPLLHTYHTVYEDYTTYLMPGKRFGKKTAMQFSKWVLGKTDRVIVPSEKTKNLLLSYGVEVPISVVPTGIRNTKVCSTETRFAIRQELELRDQDTVLVYVGRLAKEKNCQELLSYFADSFTGGCKLLFVGDGPDRSRLEMLVQALGIREHVRFVGMVPPEKVFEYYSAGDIFVSSSTSETQGITYYEAISSGLPMLCRSDAALAPVLHHGVNGFAYSNRKEFCDALTQLTEDAAARLQMGEQSRKISQEYGYMTFAQRIIEVYEEEILRKPHDLSSQKCLTAV